jgi:hypothetical protein
MGYSVMEEWREVWKAEKTEGEKLRRSEGEMI